MLFRSQFDSVVVPFHDPDVVLNHLPEQLNQVILRIFCRFLEWFESHHLCLDLRLAERANLKRKELLDVFGEQFFLFELPWVSSFDSLQQCDLLLCEGGNQKKDDLVLE